MKWKGRERKRSGSHMRHCHCICLQGVRNITVMITGVRAEIWTRDLRLRNRSDELHAANLAHLSINITLRRKLVETIRIILPIILPVRPFQAVWQLTPSVKTPSVSGKWKHIHVAAVWQHDLSRHQASLNRWKHEHVATVWQHNLSRHGASIMGESMYMLRPSVNTICQDTRHLLQVKACTCCGQLTSSSIKTMSVSYRWQHVHVRSSDN